MKNIKYRFQERMAAQSKLTPNSLGDYGMPLLLDVLNEYQAEVDKRLDEIMREAKTAKPFYDQSGGR